MSDCYCFSAPVKGCPTHDPEVPMEDWIIDPAKWVMSPENIPPGTEFLWLTSEEEKP